VNLGLFCGSRPGVRAACAEAAGAFGEAVGSRGWRLVYGGGEVGLMGIAARAAIAAGGEVLGIMPQRLLDREVGKRDLTELRVTQTMFERKEQLVAEADAFVALPGGLGTLDEILDAVTLRQLGYHAKPVFLIDLDGFWQPYRALVERFVIEGFAEPGALALQELVPNVSAAIARLDLSAAGGA
jgi:uncharacterized protein (TIGR00730 family)